MGTNRCNSHSKIPAATGVVGSGVNVHVGDKIDKQLNQYPGQKPGQQQYGDHRDIVFRATNEAEFKIAMEVGGKVAAEFAEREKSGGEPVSNEAHLLAIKLASERVVSTREAATRTGAAPTIDVTPVEAAEAD